MTIGTTLEIQEQQRRVYAAEQDLMRARLRLRALKGEPLMQPGDSMGAAELMDEMAALQNEFGARNLRVM
jgi:hypothetical protein